jgi:hypothetical protein
MDAPGAATPAAPQPPKFVQELDLLWIGSGAAAVRRLVSSGPR